MKKTIAVLHPGEMGAAIGAGLVASGHRVVWVSAGRSAATRRRAGSCGLEEAATLAQAVHAADVVFSVCPPHAAMELARAVAACAFGGVYIDANAVSAETTRALGRVVAAAGASYVDAGIIGPPPVPGASVRLYLCGDRAAEIAPLFAGGIMQAIALDGPVGSASALKVCYAAWNKGATALLAGIRALAQHEGVDAALLDEWKISLPDIPKRSEMVTVSARKAWRWIAEMEEIAANFEAAGLPSGFHLAAADIYRRLEGFKDAGKPPALAEVKAALLRKT
ncbi:MAG: NAD(P)-dependent oxidoreductase [Burkholderiales bacterium]|nr:NAD(P)-dependent oxidoreductase [Burkholderiales bacterium]